MRRGAGTALLQAIFATSLLALTLPAGAFDLQGHRGTRGLAPENTLAAFSLALSIGVTTLETDLAVTRDGVLVISHDPYLNPDLVRDAEERWLITKGLAIHALTLAELQRYDIGRINPDSRYAKQFPEQRAEDGQRFPTLAQVFELVKARSRPARLNIETKITPDNAGATVDSATFTRLTVDAIRRAQLVGEVTIQSFDWRTLVEAKKLAPEIETVCLTIETENNDTVQRQSGRPSPWHAGLDLNAYDGSLPRLVKALSGPRAQGDGGQGHCAPLKRWLPAGATRCRRRPRPWAART